MRRTIFLTVASLSIVLSLPAVHLNAVCAPAPAPSSADGIRAIRAASFIIYGTIESSVPADAHAAHSFFLKVRGYFRGAGPARVEVSDYSDGDIPAESLTPGASLDSSRQFVQHFRGQDAVVFATREDPPFTGQFATNACTYTAYGDAESSDILPLLRRIFGAPQPPLLSTTGPGSVTALVVAAGLLLVAGAVMRLGGRHERSFTIALPAGRSPPAARR
jgi:hypothetical protein